MIRRLTQTTLILALATLSLSAAAHPDHSHTDTAPKGKEPPCERPGGCYQKPGAPVALLTPTQRIEPGELTTVTLALEAPGEQGLMRVTLALPEAVQRVNGPTEWTLVLDGSGRYEVSLAVIAEPGQHDLSLYVDLGPGERRRSRALMARLQAGEVAAERASEAATKSAGQTPRLRRLPAHETRVDH